MITPLKRQLPNVESLRQQFDAVLRGNYRNFLASTHVRREAILGNRRYIFLASAFSLAIFISLFLVREELDTLLGQVLIGFAMLWMVVILITARQWLTNNKLLAKEINMALAPLISNTLNRTVIYGHDSSHREEVRSLLYESALMTIEGTSLVSDDVFTIYGEQELSFHELVVTKKERDREGREHEFELFKGVFAVATLPGAHGAETYISTDGDRTGFAHRTFWSDLFESGTVKVTELEWNDFEKKLHVASTDAVVARELLTPDVMQDIYDWWQEHQLNMRIAVKGNKFFMLLPEASIQIGSSTSSTNVEEIRKYACTLIRPMWRSLVLLEDIVSK